MKYLLIIISLSTFSCNSISQECKTVRTGVFQTPTESVGNVIVERGAEFSIERVPSINKRTVHKITWQSACKFTIEYYSGDVPPGPNGKMPILCEIIEVKGNVHKVKARITGTKTEAVYEMTRIKN